MTQLSKKSIKNDCTRWDLQDHMRESLVTSSFRKALKARKIISGMISHSDLGGQYAGARFSSPHIRIHFESYQWRQINLTQSF
jgi:hypothetical protein